ncbi:Dynein beta chain, ciliary [Amphibalanus amphitrite]|uniref:Dynein beta chain, ciliary n=1 Tax=Amphibalanus amphitrite TaxID=1232801 RepID=A0A6A4VPJ2_AMPAM|nr:Dynein beta chain, ciliary [Amphibalanus amphitrite]
MVTWSRSVVSSDIYSTAGRRVLSGVQPADPPVSDLASPSLVACLHACVARRGTTPACGAAYQHGGRCRLYRYPACQAGGGGLQMSPAPGHYVEPELLSPLCPTDDLCSPLCPPTGRILNGHPIPESTDVWTGGDKWTQVWKRLADGQCRIKLAAVAVPSPGFLSIVLASAANGTSSFLATFVIGYQQSYLSVPAPGETNGVSGAAGLDNDRQMTPLEISWCTGELRLYSAGSLALAHTHPIPPNMPFVLLGSIGPALWRLGPELTDPWLVQPDGWSQQRGYTLAPVSAIWRRFPESTSASVLFRCSSDTACRVFFRESFDNAFQAVVRLAPGRNSKAGLANDTHAAWQEPWDAGWSNGSEPYRFRVEFTSGWVTVLAENPTDNGESHTQWPLTTHHWFSRVPTSVQYVGLGSDVTSATFWVYEHDQQWGFEHGFTAGAGLFTAEEWDEEMKDCYANICDAQLRYSHEYLGNTPRLVITPLTDRCYITLTQSLHLIMGGAPAGPAGTGKTETTKDLGKALGIMVYVFNCSEQMDYKSCGNIYKGLAQTGAWGCFDEFNRISVEVLSVVAVQVKSVQDAIRDKKDRFNFLGDEIVCVPSVGIFITMNPGYAGRTELPENLKALFRPCAMVVPDIELICEIMLVSEGFVDSRLLARKFITLYTLCKELLSKQDHYDWGLRAVKSVLVVAGSLKRSDRGRPEDQVLMRALRDFNVPKIVTDDVPVFMGLIFDLFPALDVPRKRDMDFEKSIKKACIDLKLQPEDGFTLKVVQLQELLDVRHSVFIIGNAGTGKTMVWKTLFRTHQNLKRRPYFNDLNPKAVTNDELFGIINPATREWKDGLLSTLMRDMANLTTDGPRWIVLDGDIDPMWIESLNTVMDDNKVLTLASNERIALTPTMRLLFEIATLKHATPATVSRAGILYLNPQDLGWNPFVSSWIETRDIQSEKANLMILFDKYVPACLEVLRTRLKKITPIPEISHIQMLCNLLDCMLTPDRVPADSPKELYELYFCFCCVWAFGASMFQDQVGDYRTEFSRWWMNEFKSVKFPAQGTVFDYYIDKESQKFMPWSANVSSFELDPDMPLQAVQVPTPETTRLRFFMDKLMEKRHPVMLVGPPGSGKTVLINDKLSQLSEDYMVTRVPFNFYTTSEMLQRVLERPLEKKAGRNYGPPGSKKMVYFVDDMNMPEVDLYDTVQPHTMLRQHLDYGHWYDRTKLSLKEIHNVQYVAAMNPTAGSFTINPRLQRHFAVFATRSPLGSPNDRFPGAESLYTIYNSILHQHLSSPLNKFAHPIVKMCNSIVQSAFTLHQKVSQSFLPTAIKFHYVFNLRDLSNIFQVR